MIALNAAAASESYQLRIEQCLALVACRHATLCRVLVRGACASHSQLSQPCCCLLQARHRRIRRWDVLWSVYDYALKYRQLQQRKALRRKAYEAALQPRPDGAFEVRCALLRG
jgi:hypothetical protein